MYDIWRKIVQFRSPNGTMTLLCPVRGLVLYEIVRYRELKVRYLTISVRYRVLHPALNRAISIFRKSYYTWLFGVRRRIAAQSPYIRRKSDITRLALPPPQCCAHPQACGLLPYLPSCPRQWPGVAPPAKPAAGTSRSAHAHALPLAARGFWLCVRSGLARTSKVTR